jgi:hypothetical protein
MPAHLAMPEIAALFHRAMRMAACGGITANHSAQNPAGGPQLFGKTIS